MGNTASDYTIIRVTPVLTASEAYSVGDVLFTATEIPNAVRGEGGCSKVLGGFILDQDRDTFEVDLLFTELSTAIGTIHATANISDGDMEAIGLCGALKYNSALGIAPDLDNVKIGSDANINTADLIINSTVYINNMTDGTKEQPIIIR